MEHNSITLTHHEIKMAISQMVNFIRRSNYNARAIYGVPRGGIPVAYFLQGMNDQWSVVDEPERATLIVDDIVDSGRTRGNYEKAFPGIPFMALADFLHFQRNGSWIIFPWEKGQVDQSAEDAPIRLLQFVGENPDREGLKETPQRFLKAWRHWTSGYGKDPKDVMKVFADGAERYDEMIWENNLPWYSVCEHHMAPFFGTAHIAYIPDKKVCGLSKLHRVLDIFARRLQMQERLTVQVADALMEVLTPRGVGVLLKARHLCKESRGIGIQGSHTTTSALRGNFLNPTVRSEFLAIATR